MRRVPDVHARKHPPHPALRQLWRDCLWPLEQGLGLFLPLGQAGESGTRCHAELLGARQRLRSDGVVQPQMRSGGLGRRRGRLLGSRQHAQARADAQNKCVNDGGKNCELQVSRCSN
jgi:hypothetical protein